jgi:WD40 repeat protein
MLSLIQSISIWSCWRISITFIAFNILCVPVNAQSSSAQIIPQLGHRAGVSETAVSPDGRLIAAGALDNNISLWDVETGRQIRTFVGVRLVAFLPDGKRIVTVDGSQIIIWEVATGQKLFSLDQERSIQKAAVSHSGALIVVADGKDIKIWNINERRAHRLETSSNATYVYFLESIAFSWDESMDSHGGGSRETLGR